MGSAYRPADPSLDPPRQNDVMLLYRICGHPAVAQKALGRHAGGAASQSARYDYLTIVSSLIRPAANTFIDEFVRRAQGHPDTPVHPIFDQILAETFGIMVYQEDVMQVAIPVRRI